MGEPSRGRPAFDDTDRRGEPIAVMDSLIPSTLSVLDVVLEQDPGFLWVSGAS